MLFRSGFRFLVLAASAVLFAGCYTRSPQGAGAASDAVAARAGSAEAADAGAAVTGSEDELIEAHAHFAQAVIHDLNEEAEPALAEYYAAARQDPANETLILEVSRRLLLAKQSDKALELLTRATASPSASGTLFARLGFIYSQLGKPDLALAANRTAIKRDPQSLVGYQNLFLVHLQNKQPKEALGVLDEAAKVSRTGPEFLVGLGDLYGSFGLQNSPQRDAAHDRGLVVLQRAAKARISDPQLQLRLANGFNLLGADAEAAKIYQDLLRQLAEPSSLRDSVRGRLADIYLRGRDDLHAAEQLKAIISDNPTDAQAYYSLGLIASYETNYVQAVEYFSRVMLLNPEIEPVYYDLSEAQLNADQNADALATLEKIRRKFPQSFLLESFSGIAYSRQKDYTNAVSHFTAAEIYAQVKDPKRLTDLFYFQFGSACERKGDYAQAEKNFKKCLELSPDFAEAQNYLGFMWADRGEQLEQARDLIAKALKAEPKSAAYLDSMGWVLFRLNRPKEALGYLLDAVKNSEEEDATLYDHLGDIYSALHQSDQAREAWRKSLALEKNEAVAKKLEPSSVP